MIKLIKSKTKDQIKKQINLYQEYKNNDNLNELENKIKLNYVNQ